MELNLGVKIKGKPYGVGIAIGGTSDNTWGASAGGEAGAGAGVGDTPEKGKLHGKARIKAFGNWINSVSGKVYVATGDGKGVGYDGTVGSDVGAGVAGEVKKEIDAKKKGLLGIGCKIRGSLDREGHARIGGNIHSYTPEELKEEVGANSGGRRIMFGIKKTNNKIGENSSKATEEKQGNEEKEAEENEADTSVDKGNSERCKPDASVIEKDNIQDSPEEDVPKHDDKVDSEEEENEANMHKKIAVKVNAEGQPIDEHIVHKLGRNHQSG